MIYPCAFWLPKDSFDWSSSILNGRRIAGRLITKAITDSLVNDEEFHILCDDPSSKKSVLNLLDVLGISNTSIKINADWSIPLLSACGCIQILDHNLPFQSFFRSGNKSTKDYSIVGLIHSLCSTDVINTLSDIVLSEVKPWDSLICSSTAGRDVVKNIWENRENSISRRLGSSFVRSNNLPLTPVIPLPGPSRQPYSPELDRKTRRRKARFELGLREDDFVVCTVGRISPHSKSNPISLYRSLSRLAENRENIILIECGQFSHPNLKKCLTDLYKLFPGFTRIVYGGTDPVDEILKWQVLAASNVFVSLSDNIQETFGLSLLEAMLSEVPIIASDWSGYRDIVEDGETGFLIPTNDLLPSLEFDSLYSQYENKSIDYDHWIGIASLGVTLSSEYLYNSFLKLYESPDIGERIGECGLKRFENIFSTRVISSRYRELYDELNSIRIHFKSNSIYNNPIQTNIYGNLFSGFSSAKIKPCTSIVILDLELTKNVFSNDIYKKFLDLISAGRGFEFLEYATSSYYLSQSDLESLGWTKDQSARLLVLLLKFELAVPNPI